VHDALIKKYAEFYPLLDSTRQLRSRVATVQNEMESMLVAIEKQVHIFVVYLIVITDSTLFALVRKVG
jgi:hypothetical protein